MSPMLIIIGSELDRLSSKFNSKSSRSTRAEDKLNQLLRYDRYSGHRALVDGAEKSYQHERNAQR